MTSLGQWTADSLSQKLQDFSDGLDCDEGHVLVSLLAHAGISVPLVGFCCRDLGWSWFGGQDLDASGPLHVITTCSGGRCYTIPVAVQSADK